ncbi:DUF2474 family protein [Taklimakanibacter deserti]
MTATPGDRPLWQRFAWFVLLWLAGIVAVGAVAWVIRLSLGL